MFARQWFGPGSQVALGEEALAFEKLLRKRQYSKAIEIANGKVYTVAGSKSHNFWLRQRLRGLRLQQRCNTVSVVSVAFRGFWPGFREDDNEILNVLKHTANIIGAKVELNCLDPDLLIFSCFGDQCFDEFQRATRILYLGENVRPDFSETDYSLTFDMSDYCGRNIYLPLWLLRSKKYAAKTADYQSYDADELEKPQAANDGVDAVVYIGNNSTAVRIEAIHELRKLGVVVECYGSQTRPVANKILTLKQYQYSLCFENTYTPGYVTEKIIDSFLGGSRPIYWGGAPPQDFNLSEYYVCNPYQSIATSMQGFLDWRCRLGRTMPPLLKAGAFAKTDSSVILNLARILMDLF